MIVRLLCLSLLFFSASGMAALPNADPYRYHARAWSVEQGLPQITVTALVQGKRGFIWAGTQNGLARFNGTQFKVYNHERNPQLPGSGISALAVDGTGRLWIGTNKGLALYADGHFRDLPKASDATGPVYRLTASGSDVWVAAEHGLFHIGRGSLLPLRVGGLPASVVEGVAAGPDGRLWVAVHGGVYERSSSTGQFRFHPLPDPGLSVHVLLRQDGFLWVGTNRGLYRWDGHAFSAVAELAKRSVRALVSDPRRYLWIGTEAGLFRRDGHGQLVDFSASPGLKEKWIWSMALDHDGDLWIGTFTSGMLRLWNNHITQMGESAGFDDRVLETVYRDHDGSILIGGKSGIYRFRNGRTERVYRQMALPNPLINGFLRAADNRLWVATAGGIAIVRNDKLQALPRALSPLAHTDVYDLRQDADGTIWIATIHGLYRYRDDHLQLFNEQDGLGSNFLRGTFRTSTGQLWAETARGLFALTDGRFHKLCAAQHLDGQVLDVTEDASGTAWIVVADGELFQYTAGTCKRHAFTKDPLAGSLYYATSDRHGNLWLTNDSGIYRIAIDRLKAAAEAAPIAADLTILDADGVHQIHPVGGTPQAGVLDADGNLWVPTTDGMIVVDVNNPPPPVKPAPVVVESVSRGNDVIPVEASAPTMTLAPGKTDLHVAYAALDYRSPESVRFQYRLLGYDADWVNAGTRREAVYTHLPPGRYTFQVRAESTRGDRDPPMAALQIVLEPLFYQTHWFYLALALVALSLVYLAYWFRMRQLRARQAQLETLVAARTNELKQANDKLQQASFTDPLTGLKNRRYFMEIVERDVAAMRRHEQDTSHSRDMIFFMLDLDDFKHVNDTHGHHAGDAVLSQLSALLTRTVRAYDNVIRWGGEEFIVVARCADRNGGSTLAEKLRAAIAAHPFRINDDLTLACTCSIGFCAFPFIPGAHDHPSWERVVNLADAALYQAKRHGKNRCTGVQPTAAAADVPPPDLQVDLETLLARGWATLEETTPAASTENAD
jgi:diguanylate cyclase (GGDEF)-like protein